VEPERSKLEEYRTLLKERRYAELSEALDRCARAEPGSTEALPTEGHRRALRAELACRGAGPLSDLLRGRDHLLRGPALAGAPNEELIAAAVLRLAAAGATGAARRLLEAGEATLPGATTLEVASRELRRGVRHVVQPALAQVYGWLRRGERRRASREVERLLAGELSDDLRLALLELAIALDREQLAFVAAAEGSARTRALAPQADSAWQLELKAALDRWAAGDGAGAITALYQLRSRVAQRVTPRSRYLARLTRELLRDLERHDDPPGARWLLHDDSLAARPVLEGGAGGALRLIAWALGIDERPKATNSLARLRRQLTAWGVVHGRVVLDESRIISALKHGALLLLEEERPSTTGYLWLRGYDPEGRLLLLTDPSWPGPLMRPLASQRLRSGLFGFSGLLVWGRHELGQQRAARAAEDGLEHDPRLELLDRCELDEHGRPPPKARVARLAEEGMRVMPELPAFYRLRGESLLAQLRSGELSPDAAGAFERWLAQTHRRFPDAEWPYQIYAWALEAQGRAAEAGIAWAEAQHRDASDERNLSGHARALLALDRPFEACASLRRAATLVPGDAAIQAELATATLACDALDDAELESRLALELDNAHPGALLARVDVLEARGVVEEVIPLLGRASALARDTVEPVRRLLRHHVHAGSWSDARRLAEGTLRGHTTRLSAWCDAAWLAFCDADAERCHALALDALQRLGAEDELVTWIGRALVELCDEATRAPLLKDTLDQLTRRAPGEIKPLALMLADAGHEELAIEAAERARGAFGDDINGWWHLVQVLLRCGPEHEHQLARALAQTTEMAPFFAYGRIVEAWRALTAGEPERALKALEAAALEQAPALIWWLTAEALARLGRDAQAAEVRARLPEVFPRGVLDHVAFLAQLGLSELSRALLRQMVDHWARTPLDAPDQVLDAYGQLGLAEGACCNFPAALEALARVAADDPSRLPLPGALEVAVRARRWEALEQLAGVGLEVARRDSRRELDPWPLAGYQAGARLALGDGGSREQLLALAPRHPGALLALVSVRRRLDAPGASDGADPAADQRDRRRLSELAPGAARRLEHQLKREAEVGPSADDDAEGSP
jgi:hypothetical protein